MKSSKKNYEFLRITNVHYQFRALICIQIVSCVISQIYNEKIHIRLYKLHSLKTKSYDTWFLFSRQYVYDSYAITPFYTFILTHVCLICWDLSHDSSKLRISWRQSKKQNWRFICRLGTSTPKRITSTKQSARRFQCNSTFLLQFTFVFYPFLVAFFKLSIKVHTLQIFRNELIAKLLWHKESDFERGEIKADVDHGLLVYGCWCWWINILCLFSHVYADTYLNIYVNTGRSIKRNMKYSQYCYSNDKNGHYNSLMHNARVRCTAIQYLYLRQSEFVLSTHYCCLTLSIFCCLSFVGNCFFGKYLRINWYDHRDYYSRKCQKSKVNKLSKVLDL